MSTNTPAGEVKLYHWDQVSAVEGYSAGDVIAAAASLEDAKATAWHEFELWFADRFGGIGDDDEFWEQYRDKFVEDMQKDPEIYDLPMAIIVRGSD